MNAFSVLAAAYGLDGAFLQVAAKVLLHRHIRKEGKLLDPNWQVKWWIDKEASSDLVDIFTFVTIGISFLFAVFAEFAAYSDWFTAVISNIFVMVSVCVMSFSNRIVECETGYTDGRSWTSFWLGRHSQWVTGLSIFAISWDLAYLLWTRPVEWVLAVLMIPGPVIIVLQSILIATLPSTFQKRKLPPHL